MSNTFPKKIKRNLFDSIDHLSQVKEDFVLCPEKDFTRNRKLPFKKVIMLLISMGSSTVTKELLDFLILTLIHQRLLVLFNNEINLNQRHYFIY
jgi:hypothetical protein